MNESAATRVQRGESQEFATIGGLVHCSLVTSENLLNPAHTSLSDYKDSASFRVDAAEHAFTFYPAGSDRLAALIDHIECAKQCLEVFYYEFQDDHAGGKVLDAMINAAERGVHVSLIVDAFGSDVPREFFKPLEDAGAKFAIFAASWNRGYLVRNHQKFAVADQARVMTGGANVSEDYYNTPSENGWCDLGVAIEGAITERFSEWFKLLEELTKRQSLGLTQTRQIIRQWKPGAGEVQLLLGGPLIRRSHWSYQFKKEIAKALRLDMVTAYFGPPASFRRAMARVARRGSVRLIAAGKSDLNGTIDVARLYYKGLIENDAKVSEFQPSKLHMKLLVVDDCSYFGSANLDRRSIRMNIELMVRVQDKALADRLRELINHLDEASLPIDRAWYRRNAGFWQRARWRFFHWLGLADYHLSQAMTRPY